MKYYFSLLFLLILGFTEAQHLSMPVAKFKTGNDVNWANPNWDDSRWPEIKTNLNWELQGYDGYNGYAWYRFHITIPSNLKNNSVWKDSLSIFLAKIDDCDEVYLNGKLISKSGSFPEESKGYITTWNTVQDIHIATNNPLLFWDKENIIAVKTYDGNGGGGLFAGTPSIHMLDLIDGIQMQAGSNNSNTSQLLNIKNKFSVPITGTLQIAISKATDNGLVSSSSKGIKLTNKMAHLETIKNPGGNDPIQILYTFTESQSKKTITLKQLLPYILTPKPGLAPRINGAKVFGVRPGSPFLFKIAATGKKPLQYSVENLPEGLLLNKTNGVISGVLKNKGDYNMQLVVKNEVGESKRSFLVKCGEQLALTPPMGWNSWNCWGLSVSDEKVKASAKAMMDKGLIDHGWTYMNIDDGWEAPARAASGDIVVNKKFPDMKKLGDWLHSNGLKFGIYSSPGNYTCGGYLGSYQHELADASTYASWGIDYLKYDWCSYDEVFKAAKDSSLDAYKKPYRIMQAALENQSRDIVYSLCQYGMQDVWKWGASVNGNSWRTTGDIEDTWESLSGIGFNQFKQYPYAGPGHWNDPDMMIVGQVGWGENLHPSRLSPDEQYTHLSLWSILSSPLLIGCDISKLDDFTLNLLSNDEVIELNQDPLGKQAQQALKTAGYQIWVKELEDGSRAVGIFNTTDQYNVVRFYWNNLGLPFNTYAVRDVWRQNDLGNFASMFATKVAPHGVTLIRIKKA
ncbi:MAG: glycoside hydrolase family 27 protein [Chitinophagaceae bacterium]